MKLTKIVLLLSLVTVCCLGAVATAAASEFFPQSVASGDPRPDSVVLWTRAVAPGKLTDWRTSVELEVATDPSFTNVVHSQTLSALEEHDGCVKIRVGGLEPATFYYYRFTLSGGYFPPVDPVSPVGRTRTAPAADSATPVRFATVNCQDYIGRYYNAYAKLLADHDQDLDFVVQLGDAIYETDGDPSFQNPSPERSVVFEDVAGATELGSGNATFHAAKSLSNYRDLYKIYRTDPVLQQLHERWPVVFIWDDHEFGDDSWGATNTHFGGRVDELDPEQKRNAERAYFEFNPIEVGLDDDGVLAIDDSILYPHTAIYRELDFGSTMRLVLTDTRSFRPDHLVPEDAFPGTVVLDRETLVQALGQPTYDAVAGHLDPYVDLDALGLSVLRQTAALVASQVYMMENPTLSFRAALDLAEAELHGTMSTTYLNALYAAAGLPEPFDAAAQATLPRGLSYLYLNKQTLYGSTGSRYVLPKDAYELLAGVLYAQSGGAAQDLFGGQQSAWLHGAVTQSPATWTVLASSISMTPLVLDFTNPLIAPALPPQFPDVFRTQLMLSAEAWDGFLHKRMETLGLLAVADNAIVISGDQHAAFVTDHGDGIFEFTAPAASSSTYADIVLRQVLDIPGLGQVPGIELLGAYLDQFLQVSAMDDAVVPADILFANSTSNGYVVFTADAESFTGRLHLLPADAVFTNYYDDIEGLEAIATEAAFRVSDGIIEPVLP